MTKADLVEQVTASIARTAGPMISKKDCARVVDAFLEAVKEALKQQHNIEVRGFGTFKIRRRKTRMARNPRTGDPVEVAARPGPGIQAQQGVTGAGGGRDLGGGAGAGDVGRSQSRSARSSGEPPGGLLCLLTAVSAEPPVGGNFQSCQALPLHAHRARSALRQLCGHVGLRLGRARLRVLRPLSATYLTGCGRCPAATGCLPSRCARSTWRTSAPIRALSGGDELAMLPPLAGG